MSYGFPEIRHKETQNPEFLGRQVGPLSPNGLVPSFKIDCELAEFEL